MSIEYYKKNASEFAKNTLDVDMQTLYRPFLDLLPTRGRILDAGCGAGRDAKAFAQQGYTVDAFDASSELVKIASEHCQFPVQCATFTGFQSDKKYDGIWACASLLHVPAKDMRSTLAYLADFLVEHGVFYVSFKYGRDDVQRDGRLFTNCDRQRLESFLHGTGLVILSSWVNGDQRKGRSTEQWLNALLGKRLSRC